MAKKRFTTKPKQPKPSATLADWKKYRQDYATWEKEEKEKKALILEVRRSRR